jgi:hypothetical protein
MKLRPLVRGGLGIATLVAASAVWVAVGDRHWAATLVLGALALACAYPALTGRDPFDRQYRRRKHRRHRSRRHAAANSATVESPQTTTPVGRPDDDHRE